MTTPKVQDIKSLREEMKAVARGDRKAPADAARVSFNSIEAVVRLLTPENRHLLAVIRDRAPKSIAELARLTGRKSSNLSRTLAKLEAAGFVRLRSVRNQKVPVPTIRKLRVEIDPYSQNDLLEFA